MLWWSQAEGDTAQCTLIQPAGQPALKYGTPESCWPCPAWRTAQLWRNGTACMNSWHQSGSHASLGQISNPLEVGGGGICIAHSACKQSPGARNAQTPLCQRCCYFARHTCAVLRLGATSWHPYLCLCPLHPNALTADTLTMGHRLCMEHLPLRATQPPPTSHSPSNVRADLGVSGHSSAEEGVRATGGVAAGKDHSQHDNGQRQGQSQQDQAEGGPAATGHGSVAQGKEEKTGGPVDGWR